MAADPEEPLWKQVVIGDREPWRRGRWLLVSVAVINFIGHVLMFLPALFSGAVELLLSLGLIAAVSWLLFVLVWFGVGWIRWVLGIYTLLLAMALLIWALRDSAPVRLIGMVVNAYVGCALLAPSVHHFALRQREQIRWPEKLAVVAVFLLLMGSFVTGLFGFALQNYSVRRDAEEFGTRALRRVFVEKDTRFVQDHASEALLLRYGRDGLSVMMQRRYMSMGEVGEMEFTGCTLSTRYRFPAAISYVAIVDGRGRSEWGPVRVQVVLADTGSGWRIDAVQWRH
jgi:hypothetical protein